MAANPNDAASVDHEKDCEERAPLLGDGADSLPTLPELIERIGMGPAQIGAACLGGGIWFVEGLTILLINSTVLSMSYSWKPTGGVLGLHSEKLHPAEAVKGNLALMRASVTSVFWVGVLSGNLSGALVGNKIGRRQLIVGCHVGCLCVALISSLWEGFYFICAAAFFLGLCFGCGQPAWLALSAEITPAKWRMGMAAISCGLLAVGEFAAGLLIEWDDPHMHHLRWPVLIRAAAICMGVLAVFSFMFMPKSPAFLALHGEYESARAALVCLRDANKYGKADESSSLSVEFKPPPVQPRDRGHGKDTRRQFGIIFGREYLVPTCIVIYSTFTLNFVFFGSLYAFPQVFPTLSGRTGRTPAIELIIGALIEIPGWLAGGVIGMLIGRKPMMKLYSAFTGISMAVFGTAIHMEYGTDGVQSLLIHGGYYGIKFFSVVGFLAVLQYATEIYPTEARMAGSALNIGCGRVGSIVSPFVFDLLRTRFAPNDPLFGCMLFFYVGAFLCFLTFVLVHFIPRETAGQLLTEDERREPSKLQENDSRQPRSKDM